MLRGGFCTLKLSSYVSILYLMALKDVKFLRHSPNLKTKSKQVLSSQNFLKNNKSSLTKRIRCTKVSRACRSDSLGRFSSLADSSFKALKLETSWEELLPSLE